MILQTNLTITWFYRPIWQSHDFTDQFDYHMILQTNLTITWFYRPIWLSHDAYSKLLYLKWIYLLLYQRWFLVIGINLNILIIFQCLWICKDLVTISFNDWNNTNCCLGNKVVIHDPYSVWLWYYIEDIFLYNMLHVCLKCLCSLNIYCTIEPCYLELRYLVFLDYLELRYLVFLDYLELRYLVFLDKLFKVRLQSLDSFDKL
jgi:hypothetical protein